MTQEAITLQNNAVAELVEQIGRKKEITFKAPTGSGKTHMMADFMDKILAEHEDVIFLVSSLSKSDLAQQNYNKFCEYKDQGKFPHLNPYLISSEISGEEALFVPVDYNVYVLPRDLYKKGGRLMQGGMDNFLQTVTRNLFGNGLNKQVYLIKDECHIATNNLDSISTTYFTKVINFSATPNLTRGQRPDVEITEEDAVNANLIKNVEWIEEDSDISDAINKFEEIKVDYRNKLGVNPCLIVQISNKDKAEQELEHIYSVLNENAHQDLKWMLIVDKDKDCNTNDVFKAKKMPVSRWKDYAKSKESTIDIIIFKMVITEGWDIPRACMLYQVRDTKSKQLDEQVVGRVRRNPRLGDFERLSPDAQELAMKAWVWGMKEKEKQSLYYATLFEEPSDITEKIKIKTTRLKTLAMKSGFDINKFMEECSDDNRYTDIFTLYRKFNKAETEVQSLGFEYADRPCKWMKFTENIDAVRKESFKYVCNYAESMELQKDEAGNTKEVSFPVESTYTDNGRGCVDIEDWIWKRKSETDCSFAFDSDAERKWASIIQNLAKDDPNDAEYDRVAKRVLVGKKNPKAGHVRADGTVEKDKLNPAKKYLWGKNFIANSEIKYEYCLDGIHSSYPDFVMEDCYGRIHIFEVKSVNISNATPAAFDSAAYKQKMNELIRCYKQSSLLTGHVFYLPVLKDGDWHITRLLKGDEDTLTLEQFKDFIKTKPSQEEVTTLERPFQVIELIPDSQKYTTHLPLYTLRAACGYFIDHEEPKIEGWIDVTSAIPHPNRDMFVVHAKGDSMLPKIKDENLCVFELYHGGSRNGEIVLTQLNERDSDYGGFYTIKKYYSEKIEEDGVVKHTKVELQPLNNNSFSAIELNEETAEDFTTVAILKCVL